MKKTLLFFVIVSSGYQTVQSMPAMSGNIIAGRRVVQANKREIAKRKTVKATRATKNQSRPNTAILAQQSAMKYQQTSKAAPITTRSMPVRRPASLNLSNLQAHNKSQPTQKSLNLRDSFSQTASTSPQSSRSLSLTHIKPQQPVQQSMFGQAKSFISRTADYLTGTKRNPDGSKTTANLNGSKTITWPENGKGQQIKITISADGKRATEVIVEREAGITTISNYNNSKPISQTIINPRHTEQRIFQEDGSYHYSKKATQNMTAANSPTGIALKKNAIFETRSVAKTPGGGYSAIPGEINQQAIVHISKIQTRRDATSFVDGFLQTFRLLEVKEAVRARNEFVSSWRPKLSVPSAARLWNQFIQNIQINKPSPKPTMKPLPLSMTKETTAHTATPTLVKKLTQTEINIIREANPYITTREINTIANPVKTTSTAASTTYYGPENHRVIVWNRDNSIW